MSAAALYKLIEYDYPVTPSENQPLSQATITIKQAWAKRPEELNKEQRQFYSHKIKEELKKENAIIIAHYYVDPIIQDLALETGGCVGDSLEMARFGCEHPARTLIVAGVKFMGETAKILSPEKRVIMPEIEATCSLDLGCPADSFAAFCQQHPDRTVVVYANTSAEVKAHADWMVTSSIALDIISYLHARGEKIIWAPDRHLGHYIQQKTGADMLLWQGSCLVHNEFKGNELESLKRKHPNAAVLVHPESPESVIALADVVGSTSKLLHAAITLPQEEFIVATDLGIVHEMHKKAPLKTFLAAPTAGKGATCKSCAFCPWMGMNSLQGISASLKNTSSDIVLDNSLIKKAQKPIKRMLDFSQKIKH